LKIVKTHDILPIIRPVEQWEIIMVEFITASEAAKLWNISHRRVQVLCASGRVEGVFKLGENWVIPVSSKKPNDARFKVKENINEKA